MGEFIPPTDGKVDAKSNPNGFVPPSDSVELKKKDSSQHTSTPQKLASGTSTGSSDGVSQVSKVANKSSNSSIHDERNILEQTYDGMKMGFNAMMNVASPSPDGIADTVISQNNLYNKHHNPAFKSNIPTDGVDFSNQGVSAKKINSPQKMKTFDEFSNGDLNQMQSQKVPKINKKIQEITQSPINVARREKEIQSVDNLSKELHAPDPIKAEQMTKDQEEGSGFFNTMKGIGNEVVNTATNFLKYPMATAMAVNQISPKEHPFQDKINEVKKSDVNNILTHDQVMQKARELQTEENQKTLTDDKVTNFMTSADEKTKSLLNANAINKATSLTDKQKSISGQISLLKKQHDESTDENEKVQIEQKYNSLLEDSKKITNEKITADDAVKQYSWNYNPLDNLIGKSVAGVLSMGGNALYNLGSLDQSIGGYKDNVFTVSGDKIADAGDKLQSKYHQESLESVANSEHPVFAFGRHMLQTVAGTAPYVGAGAENITIKGATKLITVMAGAGKETRVLHQEMKDNPEIKYTPLQMFGAAAGMAGKEYLMIGEYGKIFSGSKTAVGAIMKSPFAKESFDQGVKAFAKDVLIGSKNMGGKMIHSAKLGVALETVSIATDELVLGKHIDNKGAKIMSSAIDMGVLPLILEGFPSIGGHIVSKLSKPIDVVTVQNNLKKINEYSTSLKDPNLTDGAKELIQTSIDKLTKENETTFKKTVDAIKGFTPAQIESLVSIDGKKAAIRKAVEEIKDPNNNAPANVKAEALANQKAEWSKLETDRADVFQNKHNAFDNLSKTEQDRLNSDAEESLQKEFNPSREKVLKLTPEQIKDRAFEIHKTEQSFNGMNIKDIDALKRTALSEINAGLSDKQKQDGYKITNYEVTQKVIEDHNNKIKENEQNTPTPEAQPQAKVPQQAEAEKVEPTLEEQYNGKDVEELVALKKKLYPNPDIESPMTSEEKLLDKVIAQKFSDKNAEIKAKRDAEKEGGDIAPDGNVQLRVDNVAESGSTEPKGNIPESVPSSVDGGEVKGEAKVSDLDHAKDQIEKGVLQWDGNPSTERVNLGISWADIRKGESDIAKGKTETVPAKRLVEALKNAKEKGGYEYVQGRGGQNHKQFVTLDDIQRTSNEHGLTDAEQKHVDAHEARLAKEHEEYFNKLDEQTQNDILDNYENREQKNNSGEIQSDFPIGESKNDVPNQESGKEPKPQEQEVKDLGTKARDLAKEYRSGKNVLPDWLVAEGAKGSKTNGINLNEAFANALDTFADVHDATKDLAKAVNEGFKHIKDWYDKNGSELNEEALNDLKSKFQNHVESTIENKEQSVPEKEVTYTDDKGNEYTSLKKEVYDAEREAEGKEVIGHKNKFTDKEVRASVTERIKSGEITETEIRDIATAITNGEDINSKLTPQEVEFALLHDKVTLNNEKRRINTELDKAINDKNYDKASELVLLKAQNELLGDDNYEASRRTGKEASDVMRAKQQGLAEDYSYQNIVHRVKEAAEGKDIPKEVKAKLEELSNNIEDLQVKIDEYKEKFDTHEAEVKKLQDENDNLQEKISKSVAEEKLEKLQNIKSKKEFKLADIEKKEKLVIDRIRAKYKDLSGMVNAGINPKFLELAPDIALLAKYQIEKGAATLEEVVGKVLIQLQDVFPDITERDVRDLFSGYGKSTIPKDVPENEKLLRQLKAKARALSGLDDVINLGESPLKTGYSHTPPTEEVKALRREIHREMRARGIDITKSKDPEAVWKTALESYKTRTQNRIDYLENIAKSKDVEKFLKEKTRTKLKLDDEARLLKKEQQNKKNLVEDMVAKADFETWNKFRKATHYAGRYFKGNLISAPTTVVKIVASVAWRSAYKPIQATSMYGVSKIATAFGSDISKVQGINSFKDLTDHIIDYYKLQYSKENLKGFKDTFMNHTSVEDVLLGKHYSVAPLPKTWGNEKLNLPQKLFFAHLKFLENVSAASHGATKNIAALPEHKAWSNTILRNLIKEGIPGSMLQDGSAEVIADHLGYLKGQRARFMQQNSLSSKKTAEVAQMVNKNMPLVADLIDMAFPILKIGSNYVGEALEKMPVIGLTAHAAKGLSGKAFNETQKSDLLRSLSNQGVGAFSLLAGAMLYQNINGFYGTDAEDYAKKHGKKLPKDEEAIWGLGGIYTHSPDAVMMKAGAQMMWYWKMYDEQHPEAKMMNVVSAIINWQTTASIINQSPYISSAENTIAPILKGGDMGKVGANFIRGRVPFGDMLNTIAKGELPVLNKALPETGAIIAKKLGMKPETVKPYEVGVNVKGFTDNVGIGIPGWRDDILKRYMNEEDMPKPPKSGEAKYEYKMNKAEKERNKQTFRNEHN